MGDDSDQATLDSDRTVDRSAASVSRYDLVLAAIPLSLLASGAAATATPVPLHGSLLAGSAVGALALVDALFRNPPGRPPRRPGDWT